MNWFALFVGAGASLGLWQVARSAPPKKASLYLDAGLWSLLAAGLGARLAYVFLHWSYYENHLLEAPQIWQGGLSAPGALAGALLAVVLLAKILAIPFPVLADAMASMLAPVGVAAWLGCWAAGSAYGFAAPPGAWWGLAVPDETGAMIPRFPLQFIAAFALADSLSRIELRKKPFPRPGQKASLVCLTVTSTYLVSTFLMGDPAPDWAGLRPDSWMAIALCLLSIAACIFFFNKVSAQKSNP